MSPSTCVLAQERAAVGWREGLGQPRKKFIWGSGVGIVLAVVSLDMIVGFGDHVGSCDTGSDEATNEPFSCSQARDRHKVNP